MSSLKMEDKNREVYFQEEEVLPFDVNEGDDVVKDSVEEEHRRDCQEAYECGYNQAREDAGEDKERLYGAMDHLVWQLQFWLELLMCFVWNLSMFCDPKARRQMNRELSYDLAHLGAGDVPGYDMYVKEWCDNSIDPLRNKAFKAHLWHVATGRSPSFNLSQRWIRPGDMCDESFEGLLDLLVSFTDKELTEDEKRTRDELVSALKRSYGLVRMDRDHHVHVNQMMSDILLDSKKR